MKRLTCFLILAAAVVACAQGQTLTQTGPPKKLAPHPAAPVKDNRPVTRNEASQVFQQARLTLSRALDVAIPPTPKIPPGSSPVSRELIVAEFAKEYSLLSSKIKYTPLPVSFDPKVLKIGAGEKSNLGRLIRMGFVARIGPLATGPTDSITPRDFGDAVGFFIARMAQVTYMPDPKWSPFIQNPNGN